MSTYEYIVDVDTPHEFVAHVEDEEQNVVYTIENINHLNDIMHNDSYMMGRYDTEGLLDFLIEQNIVSRTAVISTSTALVMA